MRTAQSGDVKLLFFRAQNMFSVGLKIIYCMFVMYRGQCLDCLFNYSDSVNLCSFSVAIERYSKKYQDSEKDHAAWTPGNI